MRGFDDEGMLEELRWRAGLADREDAGRTLAAVLDILGEVLSASEAATIAEALPPRLARPLLAPRAHRDARPERLYAHVARRVGVSAGQARERAEVACQTIAAALDDVHGRLLLDRLPPAWQPLFTPLERTADVPPPHAPGPGGTLAAGRPGSAHPLSEARPFAGDDDSVVRSDNPHAAEKLASAPGVRPGHPIAESPAGSEVPLSAARDPVRRR
jgi:uncharacterized protein (DUF2267 family)